MIPWDPESRIINLMGHRIFGCSVQSVMASMCVSVYIFEITVDSTHSFGGSRNSEGKSFLHNCCLSYILYIILLLVACCCCLLFVVCCLL